MVNKEVGLFFSEPPYCLFEVAAGVYRVLQSITWRAGDDSYYNVTLENVLVEGRDIQKIDLPSITIAVPTVRGEKYLLDIIAKMRNYADIAKESYVSSEFLSNLPHSRSERFRQVLCYEDSGKLLEERLVTPVLFRKR